MDIITFMSEFKTDKDCLDYLREKRYKDFHCPKCDNVKFWMIYGRKCMECSKCHHQEYLTANTIFYKSRTPLISWFFAIFQITQGKKGVSANQLKRQLKVTYKTAWRIAHKIREAMDNDDDDHDLFGGITQIDETWIGGKKKNNVGRESKREKSIVVGAVEHIDGQPTRVECDVIKEVDRYTLWGFVSDKVSLNVDEVHTDSWSSYKGMKRIGYRHRTVNHSKRFVFRGVSTQSIEGFWSLLKRGIIGVYHHVSEKHLHRYLAEFEFRYNNRDRDDLFDMVMARA